MKHIKTFEELNERAAGESLQDRFKSLVFRFWHDKNTQLTDEELVILRSWTCDIKKRDFPGADHVQGYYRDGKTELITVPDEQAFSYIANPKRSAHIRELSKKFVREFTGKTDKVRLHRGTHPETEKAWPRSYSLSRAAANSFAGPYFPVDSISVSVDRIVAVPALSFPGWSNNFWDELEVVIDKP